MDKDLDISLLEFDYLDLVACYTHNTQTNKGMTAISRSKIIDGLIQLEENIHRILRQLNAYDASSILIAETNWMKRNHFSKYMPKKGTKKKVAFGQVCTIDYGKSYKGEIGYVHPGLCIGKKDDKYLIVPMTTGKNWRDTCYHPTFNPNMTKEHRQCCTSEGFEKDGVLLINDSKFISGGRILELHEIISSEILEEIQLQLLYIMFPDIYRIFNKDKNKITRLENAASDRERQIANLKLKNEKLSNRIHDLECEINSIASSTEIHE